MADGLIDIGGGVKVVNPSALIGGTGGGVGDALSLMKLQMEIAERPQIQLKRALDIKKTQQEIELANNELQNIEIANKKMRFELESSIAEENRKKANFLVDQVKNSIELFRVDPNLGANALLQVIPNAKITTHGKAYKASVPTNDGGDVEFLIDPNKISDPKERIQFENQERERFLKQVDGFKERMDNFRSMYALKDDETGASDIAIISNFAKIQDPGGRVTQGDVDIALQRAGFSQLFRNRVAQAFEDGGPIFGKKGSVTRKSFIDTVKKQMKNFTEDAINAGVNVTRLARTRGLDPMAVVAPVAGLEVEDFFPLSELSKDQVKKQTERLHKLGLLD